MRTAGRSLTGAGARRRFTLIELMVAMTVLVVLVLMLFQFVVSLQRTWALHEGVSRIYQNSRVLFDLIEHDLHTIITDSTNGQEVAVYIGDPDPDSASDALHCCFVAVGEPHEDATSRLVEISYSYHHETGQDHCYVIRRQIVSNNDTANWDFLGAGDNWYLNNNAGPNREPFEDVVGGVSDFEMQFYDRTGQLLTPGAATTTAPSRVVVNVTLFDETLTTAPQEVRFRTARAFTKIFFLGVIQEQ